MSDYTPNTDEIETAATTYMWETERDCPGTYVEAPKFSEYVQVCAAFRRWHAAEIRRAKTVTAEQVEAAAEVLAEMTGEPRAGRFERTMTRAVLRAAGFYVEGDDE